MSGGRLTDAERAALAAALAALRARQRRDALRKEGLPVVGGKHGGALAAATRQAASEDAPPAMNRHARRYAARYLTDETEGSGNDGT